MTILFSFFLFFRFDFDILKKLQKQFVLKPAHNFDPKSDLRNYFDDNKVELSFSKICISSNILFHVILWAENELAIMIFFMFLKNCY